MSQQSFLDEFNELGVSSIRGCIPIENLQSIVKEWEVFEKSGKESVQNSDEPLVSLWKHQVGGKKKLRPISEFPSIKALAYSKLISKIINQISNDDVRLLETIVFDKPPRLGGQLCWHQDVPFFPLSPMRNTSNWFITIWIPLDPVSKENGALEYVARSQKNGVKASVDLHTGDIYANDDRALIDVDGIKNGKYEIIRGDAQVGDLLAHNGLTWHSSNPNITKNSFRRAIAFKYIIGDIIYSPRDGGTTSTFITGVEFKPGEKIKGNVFPLI